MPEMNITAIVETFVVQITAAMEASMVDRIQGAIAGALGAPPRRKPGRTPKQPVARGEVMSAQKKPTVAHAKVVSAKVARSRKLQGQYLGALKSLKGADRAKVRAVAKDKGVAEAVKLALGLKQGK